MVIRVVAQFYRMPFRIAALLPRESQYRIDHVSRPFRVKRFSGHKSSIEYQSEKSGSRDVRIYMESKFTGPDTLGEHSDKRLTCFHLETVVELPKAGVALSTFD